MPVSLSLRLCGENAVNRFADSLRKRGKALPSGAKTRPCGRAFLCGAPVVSIRYPELPAVAGERSTLGLCFRGGLAAAHVNLGGEAVAVTVVPAIFRRASDRYPAVRAAVIRRVVAGCLVPNRAEGRAAGLTAVLCMFSIDLNFRTAAAVIAVAGAVNYVTFQCCHRVHLC